MPYRCDYCEGAERTFGDWRAYRQHCARAHPGQPARKEAFVPDETHTVPEAEVEAEPEPVRVEVAAEAPEPVRPLEPIRVVEPYQLEEPVSGGEADTLQEALEGYSVPATDLEKILKAFTSDADSRSPAGLTDLLGAYLPPKHPSRQRIRGIVDRVYPPGGKEIARSPISEMSALTHLVSVMSTNLANQSIAFSTALANMASLGKGDTSSHDALMLKLIDTQKDRFSDKLESQNEISKIAMDVLKSQLDSAKVENERLRLENASKSERGFEERVLDISESQVAPAVISEIREGRKALVEIAKSVAKSVPQQAGAPPGVLTEDESNRLFAAQEIRERLRQLARTPTAPGGNHEAAVVSQPPKPTRTIIYE
jgi:hypothetical protein